MTPKCVDSNDISRIPEEITRYKADPLVRRRISLRTAKDLLTLQEELRAASTVTVSCPLLITHGTADGMTSHDASKGLFQKLTIRDKRFSSYPDAYHSCTASNYLFL